MKREILCALSAAVLCCACGTTVPTDGTVAIIPKPESATPGQGVFSLRANAPILTTYQDPELAYVDSLFSQVLTPIFGQALEFTPSETPQEQAINLCRDEAMTSGQYHLSVSPKAITITSGSAQGAYYAVQTLRQLLPLAAYTTKNVTAIELPVVEITDKPTLTYRGMMLDVCRHFFSVEQIKETLDILAMHKLNIFHWHLTDDQGWRIEIKKYPKLTEIGSIRKQTLIGKDTGDEKLLDGKYDGTPYGGFYTQDQIRQVVAYAKERFITVIPEIEFPGHAIAALASYPYLSCTGEQYEVRQRWDIDDRVFCIGKESTFEFIEGVLSEVVDLFPSEYIHIGGDECPMKMWEKCPLCKARMQAEGLTKYRQLQNYATGRVEKFLNGHGRKLIGWDEILEGEVSQSATIMSWRGTKGGVEAAKRGNQAIMSPTDYCYLDYYQAEDKSAEPLAIGGYLPVSKVYELDPYAGLTQSQRGYILGVQGNLWTEYIAEYPKAQYMLLPRLSALSEVGWSLDRKDYEDYKVRLKHLTALYDLCGYNYAKHLLQAQQ